MTQLTTILDAPTQQLALDDLLVTIAEEEGNGFEPGQAVGHVDFPDFRAIYLKPGPRPGQVLVKILAGWHGEYIPAWPVSVPLSKLTEANK